jgi:hypothetical protein
MVRTGYEQIVPQRSSDLFALTAKKPGIVKSLNDKGIIIEYEDDTIQGYEIGRRFGNSAGLVIPHKVVTKLKIGDTVALGDAIVYNDGFFEPDFFDPKKIVLKNATTVKTVLWESSQTLEDACSVSTRAANKLMTQITKVKTIVLRFDQYISKLVSVGDNLDSDSILCIIEDEITAGNKLFDEQTIETLKAVGSQTPRAHVKGIVEKVEVFYNGDKEDMTESILAIVNTGDKNLKKYADSLGHKAFTGSVDSGFRIENNPLGLDTVAIRVYITTSVSAGSGDKTVFGNQLKSVISSIMDKPYTTENGEMIDAIFGCQSVNDRIITSGYVIGTTNTLLKVIAKQAVALYKK